MSTRSQVAFCCDTNDYRLHDALVCRHCDGYPEGMGNDLLRFFADVKKANEKYGDTRFDDPEYLAARFIVWQHLEYAKSESREERGEDNPLMILGGGVTRELHLDIAYLYVVVCKSCKEFPKIYVHSDIRDGEAKDSPVLFTGVDVHNKESVRL